MAECNETFNSSNNPSIAVAVTEYNLLILSLLSLSTTRLRAQSYLPRIQLYKNDMSYIQHGVVVEQEASERVIISPFLSLELHNGSPQVYAAL